MASAQKGLRKAQNPAEAKYEQFAEGGPPRRTDKAGRELENWQGTIVGSWTSQRPQSRARGCEKAS